MKCDKCRVDFDLTKTFATTIKRDKLQIRECLCHSCYAERRDLIRRIFAFNRAKSDVVKRHLLRTRKLGLPSTLTIKQWEATKKHFGYRCAYCQKEDYLCLDHFVPVILSGGTVAQNCVPSCSLCNQKKGDTHPDLVTFIPSEHLERVRLYLMSL